MTEEIDINKLTNDAFMAIDALFTDEDDIFSEKEEKKEPDDFELIQEYMLAIEWECSERNIKKFVDFLNKLTPKYIGKHNQDILKMLMSILKYLEKSQAKSLPETHQVMEFIVKAFKNINQNELNEDAIKSEKNAAYNKVLDLKGKIAKAKAEVLEKGDTLQESTEQYNDTAANQHSQPESTPISKNQASGTESIESSPIIANIFARLELCENRIKAVDAQNAQMQQQLYELSSRYTQLNEQLINKINEFESKLADQLNALSNTTLPSSRNIDSDDNIESISFESEPDDAMNQYDEINFDGIDFDEMASVDTIEQKSPHTEAAGSNNLNEISLEEVSLEQLDIGGVRLPDDKSISKEADKIELDFDQIDSNNIQLKEQSDSSELFDEITADDIEYEELTADDLQYDNEYVSSSNTAIAASASKTAANNIKEHRQDELDIEFESVSDTEAGKSSFSSDTSNNKELSAASKPNLEEKNSDKSNDGPSLIDDYLGDVQKYVKCFKIDNQIVAFPDDRIYNIYKIPSKISIKIKQGQPIILGEFSSFFQNLSKNMKGHLKDIGNAALKKMNVDIELLTDKDISYKTAVLCSIDDKISIVPVTDTLNNRIHLITNIKDGKNNFSDYNINIVDIGTIPFLPLRKR